jgi:vacuolar-type H+-ATPase subunit E/Vma4
MGIEKLKDSLLSEAGEDAQKIIRTAEEQAESMMEEERGKRSAMKQEAEAEVERMLAEQRNERLAWARLESKRVMSEAREDAIKNVLEEVFGALESCRKTPEYKRFLTKSVASAVAELGEGAVIHVVKGDKALLGTAKGARIVEDLEGLGGALVEASHGRMRIDFTLETQFESRRDDIRKRIYDRLFGDKAGSRADAARPANAAGPDDAKAKAVARPTMAPAAQATTKSRGK